jgi:hypothetical protein
MKAFLHFLTTLVAQAVGFRVILNRVRGRRSQRTDRDRASDDKKNFVHRNCESHAQPEQQRDPRRIHRLINPIALHDTSPFAKS